MNEIWWQGKTEFQTFHFGKMMVNSAMGERKHIMSGNAHSFSCGLMHVLHKGSVLNCPHIWAELCHSFWEAAVNWHQHLSTTMLEKHHRCRSLAQTLTDWFCPRRDNRVMGCVLGRLRWEKLGGWNSDNPGQREKEDKGTKLLHSL